jgi:DNA-binding PucR family transcriptional regulator
VRSEVVLLELRELSAERPSLARGKLEHVLAYDAEHASAYALTLRAYLDAFGDVATAASQTSVHPNTFRYRMRRLLEIFDLDLANPEERLVIELQLRLLDG